MADEKEETPETESAQSGGDTIILDEGRPKAKTYFIGITTDAPVHSVPVPTIHGGVAVVFPCHTAQVVKKGAHTMALAAPRPGGKVKLYDDEIDALRANIAKRFIRWGNKEERRGEVVVVEKGKKPVPAIRTPANSMRSYDRGENMEPLSKYIWMISEDDITAMQAAGESQPPTIWEMDNGREDDGREG